MNRKDFLKTLGLGTLAISLPLNLLKEPEEAPCYFNKEKLLEIKAKLLKQHRLELERLVLFGNPL